MRRLREQKLKVKNISVFMERKNLKAKNISVFIERKNQGGNYKVHASENNRAGVQNEIIDLETNF